MRDAALALLVQAAKKATAGAYAPYSRFKVGAAVLAQDGRIFSGANVENCSFGLTICAERAAIFNAVSQGARSITAVAIATAHGKAVPPCGACRQVLAEFGPGMSVILCAGDGSVQRIALRRLLPRAFVPERLEERAATHTRRTRRPAARTGTPAARTATPGRRSRRAGRPARRSSHAPRSTHGRP